MFLKRKKHTSESPANFVLPVPAHQHTFKDLPWYLLIDYNEGKRTFNYRIIETYICIDCGETKEIELESNSYTNVSPEFREKTLAKVRKKYRQYLRPRAVVHDMINDIKYVKDPEALASIERLRGLPHQGVGSSSHSIPPKGDLVL